MAGAFAVMMKRRYDSIVAKQEAKEKRERYVIDMPQELAFRI